MTVKIRNSADLPSETIIKAARAETTVTDTLGRSIHIRKLTPVDRMRMSKAAGENSINHGYMLYAMAACSVVSIDGDPVLFPHNDRTLEAVVSRLGEPGYEAVMAGAESFYADESEGDAVEAAKK